MTPDASYWEDIFKKHSLLNQDSVKSSFYVVNVEREIKEWKRVVPVVTEQKNNNFFCSIIMFFRRLRK